jgi:outer membrane lipoprotein SlyB
MWALGLIIGTLIGALVAQGSGAFVGGVVGLVAGIIFGLQRKSVKRRVETLESQMLDLESRINALDQRAVTPAAAATSVAAATAAERSRPSCPSRAWFPLPSGAWTSSPSIGQCRCGRSLRPK